MINIKKFVDRVAASEGKNAKDIIIPLQEAKSLRDEITKLLADLQDGNINTHKKSDISVIEISGGNW